MNIHEIYNSLLAGKVLKIGFDTSEEAETFRVKLAQFKGKQDKLLLDVGILSVSERQKLTFNLQAQMSFGDPNVSAYSATIAFKDKATLRQYSVEILKDDDAETK